jgi:hypothetical protein
MRAQDDSRLLTASCQEWTNPMAVVGQLDE